MSSISFSLLPPRDALEISSKDHWSLRRSSHTRNAQLGIKICSTSSPILSHPHTKELFPQFD
ncbi:hypothetical protein TIFTF001_001589 [Ficus carica]|uniref:Uncharacterized protein n=1 Tax=Ficus carica TaxID=3494 RepID=A0AA88CRL0_FICCA|nr:hypothetical protein TIFTF001_001589 [Ficus carica]